MAAFDTRHPAVPAVYVLLTLALTMFAVQPVLVALSLLGAFAYGCASRGLRQCLGALRWQLPTIALVCLLNPLFSASGSTELARLGSHAVYLESLCYGAVMGALFVASVLWFQAAADMLPFDKVMALAGNAAPVITLMISMCMRMVPRFVRRGRQIAAVQDAAAGVAAAGVTPVQARLRQTHVLMGWSMEDSLQTADAMRARGWGAGVRRTTYTRYRFGAHDALALAVLCASGAFCLLLAYVATSQFSFYPTMSRLLAWWGYVPYACWMLVPTAALLGERRAFA